MVNGKFLAETHQQAIESGHWFATSTYPLSPDVSAFQQKKGRKRGKDKGKEKKEGNSIRGLVWKIIFTEKGILKGNAEMQKS